MRHNKKKSTLGRESAQRKALMRSLADSLVLHGSIQTTVAKAKALRPFIERLVTHARGGHISDRRYVEAELYTRKAVDMLMKDVAPRFKDRTGGYTRIIRTGHRPNDGAETAVIQFVD